MPRTINQLRNEVIVIQKMLDKVVKELGENEETPKVFDVTLRVITLPSTWGDDHVDKYELSDHFFNYTRELKEAIHLDDEGDEIKVLSVKEVTNDNAKLDA
jgi:hypothetical protein